MKAHLSLDHARRLFQILPSRINHIDGGPLAALDTIRFDESGAVEDQVLRNAVERHAGRHAQVHMSRTEVIDVKPDVFRQAVFDQLLILIFILSK